MSKQNTASLFKKALGAQLTETGIQITPRTFYLSGLIYWLYSATDSNRWWFQWNSNFYFSGTVILQLWVLSLVPFRHFVISPFHVLNTPQFIWCKSSTWLSLILSGTSNTNQVLYRFEQVPYLLCWKLGRTLKIGCKWPKSSQNVVYFYP